MLFPYCWLMRAYFREEKKLSEVGFEPTPTFVDQNAHPRGLHGKLQLQLESGALDHSAILTYTQMPTILKWIESFDISKHDGVKNTEI